MEEAKIRGRDNQRELNSAVKYISIVIILPTGKVLGVEPRQSTNNQQCYDQNRSKFTTGLILLTLPSNSRGGDSALKREMDCKAARKATRYYAIDITGALIRFTGD